MPDPRVAVQAVPLVLLIAPRAWSPATVLAAVRATGLAWGGLTALLILQAQQSELKPQWSRLTAYSDSLRAYLY